MDKKWRNPKVKKTTANNSYSSMPAKLPTANSLQANATGEFAGTSSIARRWLSLKTEKAWYCNKLSYNVANQKVYD